MSTQKPSRTWFGLHGVLRGAGRDPWWRNGDVSRRDAMGVDMCSDMRDEGPLHSRHSYYRITGR
jgi:hypothetical protein